MWSWTTPPSSSVSGGVQRDEKYFAAVINNCELCRDNMDELKDKCLHRIREEKGIAAPSLTSISTSSSSPSFSLERLSRDIEDAFDDCGEGFISVASEAVDILVLQVMSTMQQPIQQLFTPAWLDDPVVSSDLTTTLKDYFDDLEQWISRDAYFSRIIRLCLHSLCQEYGRRLIDCRPQLSGRFFERLKADQVLLDAFFMRYSHLITDATVTSELALLQLLQYSLQADADALELHFHKLHSTWPGHEAVKVLDTLLSLRQDMGRGQRKQVIELFTQFTQQQRATQQPSTAAAAAAGGTGASPGSAGGGGVGVKSGGMGAAVVGRSSASSSFVTPNVGLWSLFQSRAKPVKKGKPSQRQGKARRARGPEGRRNAEPRRLSEMKSNRTSRRFMSHWNVQRPTRGD